MPTLFLVADPDGTGSLEDPRRGYEAHRHPAHAKTGGRGCRNANMQGKKSEDSP
jgi:hypothetical protein